MPWLEDLLTSLFGNRAPPYTRAEQEVVSVENRRQAMASGGWSRYLENPPPRDEIVEFHNDVWPKNDFCRSREFPPEMNVANLWWRPIQHDLEISRAQLVEAQRLSEP